MTKVNQMDRMKDIFSTTGDSGLSYDGPLENIDYYSLLCKATTANRLFKMYNSNLCTFNFKFADDESVLIMFSIPVTTNQAVTGDNKHVSERIMEVMNVLEKTFISLDYVNAKEVKEDKFVYLIAIKKLKEEEE